MSNKKHIVQYVLTLCLSFVLLWGCFPARAVAVEPTDYDFSAGLEAALADFMESHRMTEQNFSFGWRDLTDGTEYLINGNQFSVGGSMYKLPLAMCCFDMLAEGSLSESDPVGGFSVGVALRLAIVSSNNDAAQALRHRISYDLKEYRNTLAKYSGLDPETFPPEYYTANNLSPRFLLNTLQVLYDRSED